MATTAQHNSFKYEQALEQCETATSRCPPDGVRSSDRTAFRVVHEPINDTNFHTPAVKNPARIRPGSATQDCCGLWGLSFFDTEAQCRAKFLALLKNSPQLRKSVGTHIAGGLLGRGDGLSTVSNQNGHFDLYEFEAVSLHQQFGVVGLV